MHFRGKYKYEYKICQTAFVHVIQEFVKIRQFFKITNKFKLI